MCVTRKYPSGMHSMPYIGIGWLAACHAPHAE
jgi:hypothetical protein